MSFKFQPYIVVVIVEIVVVVVVVVVSKGGLTRKDKQLSLKLLTHFRSKFPFHIALFFSFFLSHNTVFN